MAYRDNFTGSALYLEFENNLNNSGTSGSHSWGGAAAYAAGKVGQALSLSGGYISNSPSLNWSVVRTVGFWIKTTTKNVFVVQNEINSGGAVGIDGSGNITWRRGNLTMTASGFNVTDNQWHFVVCSVDGTGSFGTSTARVFIDGVQRATDSFTLTGNVSGVSIGNITGQLDELFIRDDGATAAQVTQWYADAAGEPFRGWGIKLP